MSWNPNQLWARGLMTRDEYVDATGREPDPTLTVEQADRHPDPDAVFVYGILLRDATVPATLAEHRLTWSGPATVVDAPGRMVYGGLVFVDSMRLRSYDRIEGINDRVPEMGYYRRERVEVKALGATVEAWVYKMNRIGVYGEHRPDPSYVAYLADEYIRLGHPAADLAVRA